MIATADLVRRSLEQVRDLVHQSAQTERLHEMQKPSKNPYDEDDVSIYGGEMKVPQYAMGETKKRRGVS